MNPNQCTQPNVQLVNLIVEPKRAETLKKLSLDYSGLTLTPRQLSDLELLMNGSFSPLTGFMNQADYESVLDRMRLTDGTLWPLPICLDVSPAMAKDLETGQSLALLDTEGFMLAVLHIEAIWPINKKVEAKKVFGTTDSAHPGVAYLFNRTGEYYVGGAIEGIQAPHHFAFRRHRHTPREMRALYHQLGWRRIVGFQTRNPLHRKQFEMTIRAMETVDANLLLQPVVQGDKPGDIDTYTRIRCYLAAAPHYPPNTMMLSLLPFNMRMAGPREDLLQAIIRKNYGCTHFIVDHDHAVAGADQDGNDFYDHNAAAELVKSFSEELGLGIVTFTQMLYDADEEAYFPADEVNPAHTVRNLSDDEFHQILRQGKRFPDWFTFPEVIDELRKGYPPRHRQGFTIFFTGLSGAGKSTIAKVLYAHFLERGDRPVTLLDGDIVRLNLSKELGFSKEHRDINVRRIGYVASEITKNRGIAICAPIAPYAETRDQIREIIEAYGGFFEVHVSTPLAVCESRDRKGLYAKARAGLIKGFTGIDDPYEPPMHPEVSIDTTDLTPDEAAQKILRRLERMGYIE